MLESKPVAHEPNVTARTDRVEHLREEGRRARIQADSERARAYTAVFKETEGEPMPLRRAKAFRRYLETCTPVIFDGELIVGSATRFRLGSHPYLEYRSDLCREMLESKEFTIRRETEKGVVDPEDRQAIADAAAYWAGKSTGDLIHREWREILGEDFMVAIQKARIGLLFDISPIIVKSADYPRVLAKGLRGLIADAQAQLAKIDYAEHDAMQRHWELEAMVIALEGMITYARRYGHAARQLAEKQTDTKRRDELFTIAENCSLVPENPPTNFWQALQFFWFIHLGLHLEVVSHGEVPGRMDQYLLPYYQRDLKSGKTTKTEMAELLGCLWVKFNDINQWALKGRQDQAQGSQMQYVTLGGVDKDGHDVTNELSFLILEVARQIKLRQPSVAVRWHPKINREFLLKAIETNMEVGGGIPSFVNDLNEIPNLMSYGVSLQDARDWGAMGCVHPILPGKQVLPGRIQINPMKIFEITLNNGVDPMIGQALGPQTGDPRTFTSVDELEEAYKQQFRYWIHRIGIASNIALLIMSDRDTIPFISAMQANCIEQGKDIIAGGVNYPRLMTGFNLRGWQNIANSFAAIQKVVFDDHQVTMEQLLDALKNDFEGEEALRQRLIAAPKWGNDDDYVDRYHASMWKWGGDVARHEYRSPWGEMTVERGGATWHLFAAKTAKATPDGRKAFQILGDGSVSAVYGTDTYGPTAVINSVLKLDPLNGVDSLFNLKFPATLLRDPENRLKLLGLIETYFEGKGFHIQFNIIDAETLRRAKAHPEEFRDLIVRIAGFSVYFVELPPAVQDEIIARTEHGL